MRYAAWLGSVARGEFGYSLAYQQRRRAAAAAANSGHAAAHRYRDFAGLAAGHSARHLERLRPRPVERYSVTKVVTFDFTVDPGASAGSYPACARRGNRLAAGRRHALSGGGIVDAAGAIARHLRHLVIPVAVLVLGMLPVLVRHVRAAMAEALDSPFALAARAHGIPRAGCCFRHVLPAALNPLISLFGFSLGTLLSASLLVEVLVGWPGLGPLFLEAIMARDFALVLGVVMSSATSADRRQSGGGPAALSRGPEDPRAHEAAPHAGRCWRSARGPSCLAGLLAPYDYAEQHRDYPLRAAHAGPLRRCRRPIPLAALRAMASRQNWPQAITAKIRAHRYPIRVLYTADGFSAWHRRRLLPLGQRRFGPRRLLARALRRADFAAHRTGGGLPLARPRITAGTLAGFHGGWVDGLLMRGGGAVSGASLAVSAAGVRAFLPLHISTTQAFFLLVAIIGTVGWVRPARIIRGVVLSARERGFVLAARGFGASSGLPDPAPHPAAYLERRFDAGDDSDSAVHPGRSDAVFLGLGVGEPVPSWGNMLAEARQYHALISHPWMLAPGLATHSAFDRLLDSCRRSAGAPAAGGGASEQWQPTCTAELHSLGWDQSTS